MKNRIMALMVGTGLFLVAGTTLAVEPASAQTQAQTQTQTQTQQQSQTRTQDRIYGSQLMTQQERAEYRQQMRALKTREERQALRIKHHKEMQERARKMGITLPDMPAGGKGGGQGPGNGMGRGRQ